MGDGVVSMSGCTTWLISFYRMVHMVSDQILCMVFICAQCGQCCMYLGDYIVIEKEIGLYHFSCMCVSTGTSFFAVIDEDKRDLFDDYKFLQCHPHACPFLRPVGDGRIVCTIHESSPFQCKKYRCVAIRIFSGDVQVGYITGMGALHTDDLALRSLYAACHSCIPLEDHERDEWLSAYFTEHGYRTE